MSLKKKNKTSRFLKAVRRNVLDQDENEDELTENDLKKWGLKGISLRSYQLQGVQWLTGRLASMQGCILGDEMGLGKTCQTISLIVYARGCLGKEGPFLVICPFTIVDNWRQELQNLYPSLSVVSYFGEKEKRKEILNDLLGGKHFHLLLTTYELCMKDAAALKRWNWEILVVDEAHRLKNQMSKLHQTLSEFSLGFRLLLTGTPIQNNLNEVYSLLTFIQPSVFPSDATEDFENTYAKVQDDPVLAEELHQVLQPFLLRRIKSEVDIDLPSKTELVIYHGMSALQKKLYISILEKDLSEILSDQGNKKSLRNVLMELRKCVNHPYLFDGVESEPFIAGEHLVEASGKLTLLDAMLAYLQKGGHHVLVFSQMTRMLNIVQDYLEFRGYSYKRLDGSVRGEERNLAIKDFCLKDVFVFLLSTKAGGVGLNLTAADTVIFMDIDFNPQNDLQAAARAHRIGQTRPVKVIRLLGRDTVEDVIYSRAVSKLLLTKIVIEEGHFSMLDQTQSTTTSSEICEICKFGVDKILKTNESTIEDVDLEKILGHSQDGWWVMDDLPTKPSDEDEEKENEGHLGVRNHMYFFEGKDYSKKPSAEDQKAFQLLQERQIPQQEDSVDEGPSLRHKDKDVEPGLLPAPTRKRKQLTEFELEQRRLKRQENAAKKAKLEQEKKKKREEQKHKNKMEWWAACGYKSICLPSSESDDEEIDEDERSVSSDESEHNAIIYVQGDVTQPHADQEDAIIVHCVDDSGWWGRGGLFTALAIRTKEAQKQYELAGDMGDLEIGNVLLFEIDDRTSRLRGQDYLALIVAQHRDRGNKRLSCIEVTAFEEGLKKVSKAARRIKASVHLPRIGHDLKCFNWYGTERLIYKHLASRGVPTFIYYYKPKTFKFPRMDPPDSNPCPSTSKAASAAGLTSFTSFQNLTSGSSEDSEDTESPFWSSSSGGTPGLPDFMRGVHVFFYNIAAEERKTLARYLVTFDGYDENIMGPFTTHVVAEVEGPVHEKDLRDLHDHYPHVLFVKKKWLESCFIKQRKVSVEKYVHNL